MINLLLGDSNIDIREWGSETEMLHYLNHTASVQISLGHEGGDTKEFYSLVFSPVLLEAASLGIGIWSESSGLKPQIMLQDEKQTIILGYNSSVVGIELDTTKVKFEINLPFLFFTLALVKDFNILFAICELGIVALSLEGKEIWRYETQDIVTNWKLIENMLFLDLLDESNIQLNIADGSEI